MCGRFDTSHLTWAEIHGQLSKWGRVATAPLNIEPNPDVRPTTRQVTARLDQDGQFVLEPMRWSLIPFWHKGRVKPSTRGAGDGFKLTTFNARVEDCASKPTFRGPFKSRRCVVPASAWWEWREEDAGKAKYRFSRSDGHPIWFAGLWDTCNTLDEGEVRSFTIMTGRSAGHLAEYHDRAPVILDEHNIPTWLDTAQDAHALMARVSTRAVRDRCLSYSALASLGAPNRECSGQL